MNLKRVRAGTAKVEVHYHDHERRMLQLIFLEKRKGPRFLITISLLSGTKLSLAEGQETRVQG